MFMPWMKKPNSTTALLAVVLVSGLVAYLLSHPTRGPDEDPVRPDAPANAENPASGAQLSGSDAPVSEPRPPQVSPLEGREVGVKSQPRRAAAGVTLAHDVAIEGYKADLWAEIEADPPELRRRGDPALDADTAYRLYMYYGNCSVMLGRGHQVDQQIEKIANRAETANGRRLDELEGRLDRILDYYELCLPISAEVDARREAVLWMGEAVRLGHEIAEIQYYEKAMGFLLRPDQNANKPPLAMSDPELVVRFQSTARAALNQALEKGHPEAYLARSQALLEGVIYPKDPAMAYAYARLAEIEASRNHVIVDDLARWKHEAARYLDPEQIAKAEQVAMELRTS